MLCVLSFSEQKCSYFQKFISQRNSEVSASKCVSEWRGKIKKPAAILWTMWTMWTQWTQKSKIVHIVHWVYQVYLKFFTHLTTGVIPSLFNPVSLSLGFFCVFLSQTGDERYFLVMTTVILPASGNLIFSIVSRLFLSMTAVCFFPLTSTSS